MKEYLEKVYKKSKKDFYKEVEQKLINGEKEFIITANPEILTMGDKDKEFDKILLDENTTIIPDGIGVIKGAKMFGIDLPERITGVELTTELIKLCDKYNKSMYLFGATEEVMNKMKILIEEKYSGVNLIGSQNGYIEDKQAVMEDIKMKRPDVVLVALGVPKQERLIYDNLQYFDKGIFVGVGGSFDVISRSKKRAPKIFIKLNLEWLYRIAFSPSRWKRFYEGNIKYVFKLKKEVKKENQKGRK
ncbi:MAG: WecB/TagA/CpsF family glycosyltransferase [Clostridia bacterium]|nr:WecB/TagA/CpsF family glycosyltransferase [Clostridia bacterium]